MKEVSWLAKALGKSASYWRREGGFIASELGARPQVRVRLGAKRWVGENGGHRSTNEADELPVRSEARTCAKPSAGSTGKKCILVHLGLGRVRTEHRSRLRRTGSR